MIYNNYNIARFNYHVNIRLNEENSNRHTHFQTLYIKIIKIAASKKAAIILYDNLL